MGTIHQGHAPAPVPGDLPDAPGGPVGTNPQGHADAWPEMSNITGLQSSRVYLLVKRSVDKQIYSICFGDQL